MKWIKTAIGAVIAISVVPFVVLSVINIKKSLGNGESEDITYTIALEYLYEGDDDYIFEWAGDVFNEMVGYLENEFSITNLYDNTNGINITITDCLINEDDGIEMSDENSTRYELTNYYMFINETYGTVYSVYAKNLTSLDITITKTIYKDNIITILLSFVSIVFVGGIILYLYKPLKNGVWHN